MHVKIALPENVSMIIGRLQENGFEAYAVGGCVRDSVMGRCPHDWDITTSALPEQTKELFKRTVDTGMKHGTITVLIDDEAYEVTTYRTDGEYEDSRHPKSVEFVKSLSEDLKRRDFTINAMAYNDIDGLVDPFDGIGDIERKLIRCVGDSIERFTEDALRIMRAVRFSAQLSFEIHEDTQKGIRALAQNLVNISAERICDELIKLIMSDHPEYIIKAYELGVTGVVLPEFDLMMETEQNNPYHYLSVGRHSVKSMQLIEKDRILRLTMLLHDIGKPAVKVTDKANIDHFKGHVTEGEKIAVSIMKRLKMDNDTIKKVRQLIIHHDWRMKPEMREVRYAIAVIGEELFPYFIKVQYADINAHSGYKRKESIERIDLMRECYEAIIREGHCVSLKTLKITGKDVLSLGCEPGPKVGEILEKALEIVIDNPYNNDETFLKEYVKSLIEEAEENSRGEMQ